MIVVSNTSPLTNLAAIGQSDRFRQPYMRLHIAEGVCDELNAKGLRWPGSELVAAAESVSSRGEDLLGFLGKLAIEKIVDGEDGDIRVFF